MKSCEMSVVCNCGYFHFYSCKRPDDCHIGHRSSWS